MARSQSAPSPIIVWFRRDLRLTDNPALIDAVADGRPIIALYILDETPGMRPPGGASRWWLNRSLTALDAELRQLGGRLILRRGPALAVLRDLVGETGGAALYWNRLYDAPAIARDSVIKAEFQARGLVCRSFNAGLLNEPWDIATGTGGPYRVFTPYWRAARALAGAVPPGPRPETLVTFGAAIRSDDLADWRLHPAKPDWSGGFSEWRPGEDGARSRLDAFLETGLTDYREARDRPDLDGTSGLSPHLAFGEIGPRQIWAATQVAMMTGGVSAPSADTFLKELGWREFNHHLLFHSPQITKHNFNPRFDAMNWRRSPVDLDAWRRGRTGYPIVDAGMRQLWATGWMHNRVRMIVASFLVKDLLIDWREGEAWFWDTLVDADVANNAANWQWVAGSGADAAPYFRIFNPTLQGEKFDPRGAYVRRWLPERAPAASPGSSSSPYPAPIVDHALARHRALGAYRSTDA